MGKKPSASSGGRGRQPPEEAPRASPPVDDAVALFARLTEESPDLYALVDRELRIRYANPAHCRARQITLDQIAGQPVSVVTGTRAFDEVLRAAYERCLAGEAVRFEAWIDYEVPGPRFMRATYTPLRDAAGEVAFAAVALHDVTPFKHAQEEAAGRAAELDAVFAAMSDAVSIYDASMTLRRVNPAARAAYGFDPVGVDPQEITTRLRTERADGRPMVWDELPTPRALCGESTLGERFVVTRADGVRRTVETASSPLRVHGRIAGAVTVWRDVTERERLRATLAAAQERAESLTAMVMDLNAGHDLAAVVQTALRRATDLLGGDDGSLFLFEPDGHHVRGAFELWAGDRTGAVYDLADLPHSELALTERHPVYFTRAEATRQEARSVERQGTSSVLVAPLLVGTRPLGFLYVTTHAARPALTPEDLTFADSLAAQCALAIDRAAVQEDRLHLLEREKASYLAALRVLGECSEALVRAPTESELLQRVCDVITQTGGYRMAWVGFAEPDEGRSVRPAAWSGVEEGYLRAARITWGDDERGRGPTGRCIRTGETVVASAIATSPDFGPWREEAARRGYASSAALPLEVDGRVVGALMIYATAPDAFDGDALHLLRQLADNLAFGLGALRTRGERERMQGQLMLADRMSSMGMLAAGVAHEINNPLAYAMANLELMSRDLALIVAERSSDAAPVPPALRELEARLKDAREGTARVRDIVRDLKLFSRVDEQTVGLVDLRQVLDASVRMVWNEIKHRGRLVREYGDMPLVRANEARLGQVVLNLLTNAVQALPEEWHDHSEVRVVGRTDAQGRAVIEVSDTGPGIAPAHLARLFEPFFTTKPVGVGTGLGLSICHTLVTAAGGAIEVASEVGRGSTFRVLLPPAALEAEPSAAGTATTPAPAPRPGRILVVDDEEHMCALMRSALEPHDVVTLTDPAAALELLHGGERFDLILCDMMMPELTGLDFHARLATFAPQLAERVVFMTGGAFTARTRDFLADVPNQCLEKPFELSTLRALVSARLD